MAAGTTIQLKRKAGAFTGGQLAAGEAGVDTTNNKLYFSKEGSTVTEVGSGGGAEKWAPNWDGQGSVITGDVAYRAVVASGTITSIALVGQPSGSVTMTVKKYTPSGGALGSPTTLGTGSLSSAVHSRTTGLSWSVTAGDVLEFTPSSITSITRLHVTVST